MSGSVAHSAPEPGSSTDSDATGARSSPAPVALIVFNRPDTTARVLEAIRTAGGRRLLVVADGPRPGRADDARECAAVRRLLEGVDWAPSLELQATDQNLGLKRRIESGLDWVFERAEQAIILEDDCVPDPTFFAFCDELLTRYHDDRRVLAVSGTRPVAEDGGAASYAFSRYVLIWGWATWRRAWRLHDPEMRAWPALRDQGWLAGLVEDPLAASYWSHVFQRNYEAPHTWDYAWMLACWRHEGLCAVPRRNLVANLGFGPGATHTTSPRAASVAPSTAPLAFPLTHPAAVERDTGLDAAIERAVFSGNLERLVRRVRVRRAARLP